METKVSYPVVGAFVLLLSAALVAGVLWLGSDRRSGKAYESYVAYFAESVSGLNVRAPVKYKGVEVGAVREMGIDPVEPDRVRLVLAIERGIPIKQDTVAFLSVQGLTGIAFVELSGGSRDSPLLAPDPATNQRAIPTGPSLLRRLDTAATTLLADLDELAVDLGEVLDAPTRAALRRTVRDLDTIVHSVAVRSRSIDASLLAAARTLERTAEASERLAATVDRVGRGAEAVERAGTEVAAAGLAARAALVDVQRVAAAAGAGAAQLDAATLPELTRLLAETRESSAALGRVARELERNPSMLLMGRKSARPGPGE